MSIVCSARSRTPDAFDAGDVGAAAKGGHMSETEAYDRVLSCVMNHPLNREALIEILRYCEQERDQADVEAHM